MIGPVFRAGWAVKILARKNRANFGPTRFWPGPLLARPARLPALDRIEIPADYILSLEDDIPKQNGIQRIDLPRFRGNSLIGNSSRNSTSRRSFRRIREEVHSHFLIKENYYNGEREVEETKILIDTGAS